MHSLDSYAGYCRRIDSLSARRMRSPSSPAAFFRCLFSLFSPSGMACWILALAILGACASRMHLGSSRWTLSLTLSLDAIAAFSQCLLPPDFLAGFSRWTHSLDSLTVYSRRTLSLAAFAGFCLRLHSPDSLVGCFRWIHSLAALPGFCHWLHSPDSLARCSRWILSLAALAGLTSLTGVITAMITASLRMRMMAWPRMKMMASRIRMRIMGGFPWGNIYSVR
jgi:hypothetical protein